MVNNLAGLVLLSFSLLGAMGHADEASPRVSVESTESREVRLERENEKALQARQQAYARVCKGDLLRGAETLVVSLRALPQELPELVDVAGEHFQLLLFSMEYLMDEETLEQFQKECLKPEQRDMDSLVLTLFTLYLGQESEAKTAAVRDLMALTSSKDVFVRLAGLYMLSSPYYFGDTPLAYQSARQLVEEFPYLDLSHEALRLQVYFARKQDRAALERAINDTRNVRVHVAKRAAAPAAQATNETAVEEAAVEPIDDPVLDALEQPLRLLMTQDRQTEGMRILCSSASGATDWKVRYACMLMAEPYEAGDLGPMFHEVVSLISARDGSTPDIVRARLWRVRIAQAEFERGNTEAGRRAADEASDVLKLVWREGVIGRSLYEEVMKTVMACADKLAQWGRVDDARLLYRGLAQKYPSSKVSSECEKRLADLST